MPLESTAEGSISLSRAIDHYFEICLFLLVLTGFGMLASTGGVDLPTVLLVGMALAARGYLLAKRKNVVISERWTTPLSLFYFFFFGVDYVFVSRSFLPATVHLALFAVVIRIYSLRRERDHTLLAILAFLMVLASSVLTVDSIFIFFFAVFILMAVATFVLMEMRRSGHAASIQARHSRDPQEHRHLAFSLAQVAPGLMLLMLLTAAVLFLLLPRTSAVYLGAYSAGTDFSTGFSDRVQLGGIGQIQQSKAVVMHVQIDGDKLGRYNLRWRGIALEEFDGHTWSSRRELFKLQKQADGSYHIPALGRGVQLESISGRSPSPSGKILHYHVLMEPIGTKIFFLAPWATALSGHYEAVSTDLGGAVFNLDSQRVISRYDAESDIARATPADLRKAGTSYPPRLSPYLSLPAIDARIPRLATEVTGSAANNYDRAAMLETYLKTHFGYTLQLPRSEEKDPLASFLFARKQGHCEYFASSMAVMLRTLGIPSRVVNGFRSDEFNDLTGNYVIRAKDAHAWVEAYFPAYGWQTFDPTPPGDAGPRPGWNRIALYLDAAASFWREWVVSYDASHQYVLGQSALSGSRSLWEGTRAWARQRYDSMLAWARHTVDRVNHSPWRWGLLGIALTLALLLLGNASRIARMLHESRLRARPERSPEQAAAVWYQRMTRVLARHGLKKSAAQTAQEFVRKIEDEQLRARVERFTGAYESARFGNSTQDAKRLPELCEEVELAAGK
jgi:hypothetical protein